MPLAIAQPEAILDNFNNNLPTKIDKFNPNLDYSSSLQLSSQVSFNKQANTTFLTKKDNLDNAIKQKENSILLRQNCLILASNFNSIDLELNKDFIKLKTKTLNPHNHPPFSLVQNNQDEYTNPYHQQTTVEELRQELKIRPKVILTEQAQTYSPSLSAGIPSAFGANWGDVFVTASGATAGKERNNVDGSISVGFGLGDSYQLAGLTFAYNIGSIRDFGSNGTFDLQGSRIIYVDSINQVAAAIGWSSFAQYGNEGNIPSTVWGGLSSVTLLNPENTVNPLPLFLSVGVGGGYFSNYDGATNAFGGVGLQVLPQLGLGAAWSGVGLNMSASFVPVPTIPLTINVIGGDLTNTSEGGSRLILSVSYGYNFIPRGY